jgi:hypothetical protein
MTEILLGPTLMDGPTTKVKDKKSGKTYYKKLILREGEFQYTPAGSSEKIKLDLSAPQLKNFVQSFKDKAYDEVPFQFGRMTMTRAFVRERWLTASTFPVRVSKAISNSNRMPHAYVEKYPNFGVSPRLVLDINRADGKKFVGAIQHVAGTVVPRLTGMGPWSKVELSEEGDTDSETPVIDLSTEAITVERERKVIDVTDKKEEGGQVVTLSQEEYDSSTR